MTRRLAWFFGGTAAAGVFIALGLFLWGGLLDARTSQPIWPLTKEALFLPGAALADHVWRGDLRIIHLLAALQWPLVMTVAAILFAVWRPRSLVGRIVALGTALLVPVAPAVVFAASALRGQIAAWWGVWLIVLVAAVGSRRLRSAASRG